MPEDHLIPWDTQRATFRREVLIRIRVDKKTRTPTERRSGSELRNTPITVALNIDVLALAEVLALRAHGNKNGCSTLLAGIVFAKVER